ncbi:segregation and condensation protein A [Rhodohalobacter sulfatireducens]|uniref:Segregation and condensation protein A n=1 Tax=Rhodohalobacter sulfatireducens TaxID=2911366 RepID=A0ABS9KHH0_9BACT|nr:segregation/condensation protein A [Rhodohalobacter sulfatireducens]MCG2590286.1 segregation/condensation protein A [Rhodohalobacter sulfatireducens]
MYRVQLKNFEGPLDLLLFFIKRDELNIYDIPISHITHEFLVYIRLMEELDLDVASEFIYMASMLMSIKARMMLPFEGDEEEEIDEDDPRYELVQKLLEYKRYKEMAEKMTIIDEETQKKYYRGYPEADEVEKQATGEALKDVTLFDLMGAFRKVLADIKRQNTYHKVERVSYTVEEQTEYILQTLQEKGRRSFLDICKELRNKSVVVVTFLAVLEMLKEQQINLFIENEDPIQFYIDLKPVDEIIGTGSNVEQSS